MADFYEKETGNLSEPLSIKEKQRLAAIVASIHLEKMGKEEIEQAFLAHMADHFSSLSDNDLITEYEILVSEEELESLFQDLRKH